MEPPSYFILSRLLFYEEAMLPLSLDRISYAFDYSSFNWFDRSNGFFTRVDALSSFPRAKMTPRGSGLLLFGASIKSSWSYSVSSSLNFFVRSFLIDFLPSPSYYARTKLFAIWSMEIKFAPMPPSSRFTISFSKLSIAFYFLKIFYLVCWSGSERTLSLELAWMARTLLKMFLDWFLGADS